MIYQKLESMFDGSAEVTGLKTQIAPCIWNTNEITGNVDNKEYIHIESKVLTDDLKDIFHNILVNGIDIGNAEYSLYSRNAKFFYNASEDFAKNNPTEWYTLIVSILRKTIILPIECEDFNMGLTIFSTLNDRGMPLSDSDIFKAQMYKLFKTDIEKSEFIEKWKNLEDELKKSNSLGS